MKLNDTDIKLLEKWLEDESFLNWAKQDNENDTAKWENYLNLHTHHWELAKMGRELAIGIPFKEISADEQPKMKALTKLLMQVESGAESTISSNRTKALIIRRSWMVAASLAILIFASGMIYSQFFQNKLVSIATEYGEKLETLLPDGSIITLNANSKIQYNSNTPRKIWLEGEAFFDVKKLPDTNENFLVITKDLTVYVFGTSFNVNSRNEQTKVFLEEGKVSLEMEDSNRTMHEMQPGDLVTYSKKQNKLLDNHKANALMNTSWKIGTLMFNETTLLEALPSIEEIYGIEFVLKNNSLKEKTISGGVPINNLKTTLETLQDVHGIKINKEGKNYLLDVGQ